MCGVVVGGGGVVFVFEIKGVGDGVAQNNQRGGGETKKFQTNNFSFFLHARKFTFKLFFSRRQKGFLIYFFFFLLGEKLFKKKRLSSRPRQGFSKDA